MPRFVSPDGKQVIETEVPRESVQLRAEGFTQEKDSTAEAEQDNTAGTGEVEQTEKTVESSKSTKPADKPRSTETEQTDKSADTSKSTK